MPKTKSEELEPSTTATPTAGETSLKPAEETVEVKKSFLDNLQKQMEKMKDKQQMLEQVADKKQLARFYRRNQKKLPSEYMLRMIDGKVILGWRMVEDKGSYKNQYGAWVEYQKIEVIYEDGKKEEMTYQDFANGARRYTTIKATLQKKIEDEKGNLILEVKRNDNGKVYKIDVRYVN